jgi:hypothetical protein
MGKLLILTCGQIALLVVNVILTIDNVQKPYDYEYYITILF